MDYLLGIDVSEHNGVIDWEEVNASGLVSFAILRAGYGVGVEDKQFHRNASECNRLGIPISVYWFSYATTTGGAEKEAEHCAKIIENYKIDGYVAYDFEDDSVKFCKKLGINIDSKDFATSLALNFMNKIRDLGYPPILYSNPAYLSRYFDRDKLKAFPLWLAKWPDDVDLSIRPAENPDIWQYSSIGCIPGINGPVDLNISYEKWWPCRNTKEQQKNNLTKEEILKVFDLEKQKSWAEPEVEKAINMGISDGSRPYEFASRAEVMAMVIRAIEYLTNKN